MTWLTHILVVTIVSDRAFRLTRAWRCKIAANTRGSVFRSIVTACCSCCVSYISCNNVCQILIVIPVSAFAHTSAYHRGILITAAQSIIQIWSHTSFTWLAACGSWQIFRIKSFNSWTQQTGVVTKTCCWSWTGTTSCSSRIHSLTACRSLARCVTCTCSSFCVEAEMTVSPGAGLAFFLIHSWLPVAATVTRRTIGRLVKREIHNSVSARHKACCSGTWAPLIYLISRISCLVDVFNPDTIHKTGKQVSVSA